MSIYKQNIDPIALTEADADEFLRDMDITLYEDTIMIEGTEYEGTYGEEVLAENGIFLYEDGIVLEGKQAEEYKARKAAEKKAESDKWERKYQQRMGDRSISTRIVAKDRPHYAEKSWNDDDPDYHNSYSTKSGGVDHNRVRTSNMSPARKINHAAINFKKHTDAHMAVSKMADKRAYENKWANDDQKVDPVNTYFKLAYATDAKARNDRKQAKKYAKPKNESTIFSDIEII